MNAHTKLPTWSQFYAGRTGHDYRKYVSERYDTFIERIIYEGRNCHTFLELGVGMGTITSILMERMTGLSRGFAGVDRDEQMVETAGKNLMLAYDEWGADEPPPIFTKDIRYLELTKGKVKSPNILVHSHGVLEHFSDEEIRQIVQQFDTPQVHYVPGNGYGSPSRGDERLLPLDYWRELVQPQEVFTFNGGLDYGLVLNPK